MTSELLLTVGGGGLPWLRLPAGAGVPGGVRRDDRAGGGAAHQVPLRVRADRGGLRRRGPPRRGVEGRRGVPVLPGVAFFHQDPTLRTAATISARPRRRSPGAGPAFRAPTPRLRLRRHRRGGLRARRAAARHGAPPRRRARARAPARPRHVRHPRRRRQRPPSPSSAASKPTPTAGARRTLLDHWGCSAGRTSSARAATSRRRGC